MYHDLDKQYTEKVLQIQRNEETYLLKWAKIVRFVKILVAGTQFTNFEQLVLKESNDCLIVLRYSKVERFELTSSAVSIKEIFLNVVRIQHPLRRFTETVKDLDLVKNSRNLNYEDMEEKLGFLANLATSLDELPVVVLIHGLGGQISQFEELLLLLSQSCDCFAVDLPGFGMSRVSPNPGNSIHKPDEQDLVNLQQTVGKMRWRDFTSDNVVELLVDIILGDSRLRGRKLVLVGHSMGTHLAIKLQRQLNRRSSQPIVKSLVLLSPPGLAPVKPQSHFLLAFLCYFPIVLNLLRVYDRLGGLFSHSITRMVAATASVYTKIKQLRWNLDSDLRIWLRYAAGFQQVRNPELVAACADQKNVLLLCGAQDVTTPPQKGYEQIRQLLESVAVPVDSHRISGCGHSIILEKPEISSGLILKHLVTTLDKRLDPSYVLILKAIVNGDKWGLKNFKKWQSVPDVSELLINPTTGAVSPLLATKTLRNNDEFHSPEKFEANRPDVIGVIDISSDGTSDSYDPGLFRRIKYYKLPTISKIPPEGRMIRKFTGLVSKILREYGEAHGSCEGKFIAVHCHYGFNRTGYVICCYLIEILGWKIEDAIQSFRAARAPGIKHPHFTDSLYLQYEKE